MLELMYASGLRVSELVTPRACTSLTDGALRITGKALSERLVPFSARRRASWLERYLADARGEILQGQTSDALFRRRVAVR